MVEECINRYCNGTDRFEIEGNVYCVECMYTQCINKDDIKFNNAIENFDFNKKHIWKEECSDYSETDSEFSDTEGNYCINDDCCAPSTSFVTSSSQIMCTKCGTVQQNIISDEKDWNNYTDSQGRLDNNGRCAAPINSLNPFVDTSSTFISKGFMVKIDALQCESCKKYQKDQYYYSCDNCDIIKFCYSGTSKCENCENNVKCHKRKTCEECKSTQLVKRVLNQDLSKIHMRINYNHRKKSFDIVQDYIENIGLIKYSTQIVNTALKLWGDIMLANKLTRAGVRKGLIACCIYYSCINHGTPRTPIEICKDFKMNDTKQFNKGNKEFRETFEKSKKWSHLVTKTSDSEEYFQRFCNTLDLKYSMINTCNDLYNKYKLHELEVIPKSAAAGIIYYLCCDKGIKVSKTVISKKLGVCNPTLTKTVKLIEKRIKKIDKKLKKKNKEK